MFYGNICTTFTIGTHCHSMFPRSVVIRFEKSTDLCSHLFIWVEDLLLEAEALDLVEVLSGLERHHVVCGDASHRSVGGVLGRVECQSCLPRNNLEIVIILVIRQGLTQQAR